MVQEFSQVFPSIDDDHVACAPYVSLRLRLVSLGKSLTFLITPRANAASSFLSELATVARAHLMGGWKK